MFQKCFSLYVHIPFCLSKCAYCDFFSKPCSKSSIPFGYIHSLCNEIKQRFFDFDVKSLKTIYIGGGTPSLLSKNDFEELFSCIKSAAALESDCEITVEVNPDDVTKELLETLQKCGVNRISCGIQTMNQNCLKFVGRRADSKTNQRALELLQNNWKGDVSVDLISALPGDDEKNLLESINQICKIKPAHISLYSLTIEENTALGRALAQGAFDYDFDKADKLWLCGRDYLEKNGYSQYEVSNFSLPEKNCHHNLVYWNHQGYIGCGSGATGTVYNQFFENEESQIANAASFEKEAGLRWTNTTDVEKYISFWNQNQKNQSLQNYPQNLEKLTLETSQFEFFMMGMRKLSGITKKQFFSCFKKPLPQKFLELFSDWEKKGLAFQKNENDDVRYALNSKGILFLNTFLEELL
ncbi:MAG: radical SAM family heme chaperone HemW [Treponema sp.]|nr:radical SAM family heme chaperone HemW [Treponema sp.]